MNSQRLYSWEHCPVNLGGVWEVFRAETVTSIRHLSWRKVTLPHCINAFDAADPDKDYYQGEVWYRTKLKVENPYPNGRTFLHFEGAGQNTDVYVHTTKVGSHVGGYDEFEIDLTDAIEQWREVNGSDTPVPLAVMCDNSRNLEQIPSDASDFHIYGGLYRYVNLVYVPAVSIARVYVSSPFQPDLSGKLAVILRLRNPGQREEPVATHIQILDPDGQLVYQNQSDSAPWENMKRICETRLGIVQPWSPDQPNLYRCVVALESTAGQTCVEERFGFRWFEFQEHGGFFLNGEKLFLRGTHRHEDHAGVGAAMSDEMTRRELQLIKDMGANFLRLGHYQQSRVVLDLCDELGLLVWEEIPWCRGGLGGESYQQQCRDSLSTMIEQHYNHPSVIIWGLGNENDWDCDFKVFDENAIRDFMRELHELSHRLDSSRLTGIRRCDFCRDVVDVYSPSIWAGWYRGRYEEYQPACRQWHEKTPRFVHLEWGGSCHAGRHAENPYAPIRDITTGHGVDERNGDFLRKDNEARVARLGDWSETYMCDLIDWHLKEQLSMQDLAGAAHWIFKDFASPVRPNNPIPYVNQKGIVQRDLTPKEAYYVFQSYWSDRPMIRIYGHAWPRRWGRDGQKRWIKVYSNCEQVELFVNGVSRGVRLRDPADFPAAGLRWDVAFEEGENQVRAVGRKGVETVCDELTFTYQTQLWGKPKRLTLHTVHRKGRRLTAEARVVDADGILCLDSHARVRFELAGAGSLQENLGIPGGSRVIECGNGTAQIVVELDPTESAVIAARSDGLETAFLAVRFSDEQQTKGIHRSNKERGTKGDSSPYQLTAET